MEVQDKSPERTPLLLRMSLASRPERRVTVMASPSSLLAMTALIGFAVVEVITHLLPWG
mgnify:CR=1 FL=1